MRRALDAYYTPAYKTRALLIGLPELRGIALECCAGDGAIARVLRDEGGLRVIANDPDRRWRADMRANAARPAFWRGLPPIDWVVSNPPYLGHPCLPVVALAFEHARVGVAMLLRLSFLEPTAKGQPAKRLRSGRIVPASPGARGDRLRTFFAQRVAQARLAVCSAARRNLSLHRKDWARHRHRTDGRSTSWLKIKNPRYSQMPGRHELVLGLAFGETAATRRSLRLA